MKNVVVLLTMALMTFGCGDDGPNGEAGSGGAAGTGGVGGAGGEAGAGGVGGIGGAGGEAGAGGVGGIGGAGGIGGIGGAGGEAGAGGAGGIGGMGGGVPQVCGDHECVFTAATGSVITLQLAFGPVPLPATGAVDVLCGANTPDANGKCACSGEFVSVDPLTIPGLGFACLVPVPSGECPEGEIDCDGGNDQDIDLAVDHNLGTTLSLPDCADNATCQADCGTYCAGLGAVPASAQCEGYCQLAGTPCNTDDPTDPDPILCPAGDTCVGGDPVIHPGACQCQRLTLGDGTPDAAGDAQVFAGFGLTVLLVTSPGDVGPDGLPCTEDDDPSITIPPQCAPFTTTSASTLVTNAGDVAGATNPTSGDPLSTSGAPFVCNAEDVPTGATGANLRTAASFLDTTLGDLAATVELNCQ